MFALVRFEITGVPVDQNVIEEITPEILRGLFDLSSAQEIANIVGDALLKNNLLTKDPEVAEKFEKKQLVSLFAYENFECEIKNIRENFAKAGITFIFLKGSAIRKLYPEPWMRTSCDIDVLVPESDIEKAKNLMTETLKYAYNDTVTEHEIPFDSPNGVHVELHVNPIEDGRAVNSGSVLKKMWDYAEKTDTTECFLSDDMYYFYHIAHIAKHFERGGCGVRPFIDLFLLKTDDELTVQKRNTLINEAGLADFHSYCQKLSEFFVLNARDKGEIVERMSRFVLSCGIYGSVESSLATSGTRSEGSKKYIIGLIFPNFAKMKRKYKAVDVCPLLLPLFWIVRWFDIVFFKSKKFFAYVSFFGKGRKKKSENALQLIHDVGL